MGSTEATDIRGKVALRAKAIRTSLRLRQDEVSQAAGITRQHVAKIESAETNPTIESIQRLADALGVTLRDFFDDDVFDELSDSATPAAYPNRPGPDASVAAHLSASEPCTTVEDALRDSPDATIASLARSTGLGTSAVEQALNRLRENGRVSREGSRRYGRWVLRDNDC